MFSVIIPCCNRLEPLSFVLASFCRQLHAPAFEVLLIDNNSEVDIGALYRQYKSALDLKLVRMPRLPNRFALCRARNRGLRLARYPWIVSLDSDCVLNDDYLSALATRCEVGARIFVGERVFCSIEDQDVGAYLRGQLQAKNWPRVHSMSNYYKLVDRRFPQLTAPALVPHPWAYAHGGNCSFRREDANHIGGFDEAYDGCWGYEDIDFAYRLAQHADASIEYVPGMLTYHAEMANETQDPSRLKQMMDKSSNRNWRRITGRIAGYEEFKKREYATISESISV